MYKVNIRYDSFSVHLAIMHILSLKKLSSASQPGMRGVNWTFFCMPDVYLVRGCIPLHYTVLHFDFIIHTDITDRRLARSLSLRRISHVDCMTFTSHIPWNMIWASVCYHQPMVMVVVPSQAPLCRDARGALLPSSFVSQPVHNTPIHSVIGRPRVV